MIGNILLTTRKVELIKKNKFVIAIFHLEHKSFIVYIAALSVDSNDKIHLSKKALIVYLNADKAPTKVASEYIKFADVFLPKLATKHPDYMRINDHAIELINDQKSLYSLIYSLNLVELGEFENIYQK